eukprot:CFRG2375T1
MVSRATVGGNDIKPMSKSNGGIAKSKDVKSNRKLLSKCESRVSNKSLTARDSDPAIAGKTNKSTGNDIDDIFAVKKSVGKVKSDIDDIFAVGKKPASTTTAKHGKNDSSCDESSNDELDEGDVYALLKNKKIGGYSGAMSKPIEDDDFFDARGLKSAKRKKIDGVYVYTHDELKLKHGAGTTNDCPFDCKCCY